MENKEQHHVSNSSFNDLRFTIKVLCTCSKPDLDTPEKTPKLKRLEQSRPLYTTVSPKEGIKMAAGAHKTSGSWGPQDGS